ncbi:unnamed protein product [Prunus brigantina]
MATGKPSLDNVLLVENLQANLISVSQFCDEIGEVETSHEDTDLETHEFVDVTGIDFEDCNQPFNPVIRRPNAKQVQKDHSFSDIIRNVDEKLRTQKQVCAEVTNLCYVSLVEPKSVTDALADNDWILAMQEELNQFKRNHVWYLVPCPKDSNVIGLDFDETFAPVVRLESVRLLLSIACHLRFKLHQMDVKSAFLNGVLQEEVYVEQPTRFQDPIHHNHVYRLKKALYGLNQAPRAWYDRLSTIFFRNGTLLVQQFNGGMFISQTKYAKNLVFKFGLEFAKPIQNPMSTSTKLSKDSHGKSVYQKLYRRMIGNLLYLTANRPDISFSVGLCARFQSDPKESHRLAVKRILRYVGNIDDRKSTTGGCFYIGKNLVSWSSKNQNCVSLSTVEAEYITTGSCCIQLLWMKQMLNDYDIWQDWALALHYLENTHSQLHTQVVFFLSNSNLSTHCRHPKVLVFHYSSHLTSVTSLWLPLEAMGLPLPPPLTTALLASCVVDLLLILLQSSGLMLPCHDLPLHGAHIPAQILVLPPVRRSHTSCLPRALTATLLWSLVRGLPLPNFQIVREFYANFPDVSAASTALSRLVVHERGISIPLIGA